MKHYKGDMAEFIIETEKYKCCYDENMPFISDRYKHTSNLIKQVSCKVYNQKRQSKVIAYLIDTRRINKQTPTYF